MGLLCHPWFTTTNLSYRSPIFETSATALCGTTGIRMIHISTISHNNYPLARQVLTLDRLLAKQYKFEDRQILRLYLVDPKGAKHARKLELLGATVITEPMRWYPRGGLSSGTMMPGAARAIPRQKVRSRPILSGRPGSKGSWSRTSSASAWSSTPRGPPLH